MSNKIGRACCIRMLLLEDPEKSKEPAKRN
jgi:hypothetical protein